MRNYPSIEMASPAEMIESSDHGDHNSYDANRETGGELPDDNNRYTHHHDANMHNRRTDLSGAEKIREPNIGQGASFCMPMRTDVEES